MSPTHLKQLEAESIHVFREAVAVTENPVILYSIGKDCALMLHLARKACFPEVPPLPLLQVDCGWKLFDLYGFRDRVVLKSGMCLLFYFNPGGIVDWGRLLTHNSELRTDVMIPEDLEQALDTYFSDAAFGWVLREREKSETKERGGFIQCSIAGFRINNVRSFGTCTAPVSIKGNRYGSFRRPTGPSWNSGSTSFLRIFLSRRYVWRPGIPNVRYGGWV